MELIRKAIDMVLHLDKHLDQLVANYGPWVYAIIFLIVFAETGLVVTPITLVASYYLAIGTFRFGLDPDNQSVPIITSAMDLAGVATVLFVMTSLGVLPNG